MANVLLSKAKKDKFAEFYTRLEDIEAELRHYKEHFRNKVVFCNCDDPYESYFFKYFAMNFNHLGLKKLIATCYAGSAVAGNELPLFCIEGLKGKKVEAKTPYRIEITQVKDENFDGAVDLFDVEQLLKNEVNSLTLLKGDGDFRSLECVQLLKEADIIVTNPPFPLFHEYVAQLMEYGKSFIIIGNTNALTYKDIFNWIQENKIRTGYTNFNVGMYFYVPDSVEKYHKIENGRKMVRVSTSCWFTNLEVQKHKAFLTLYKKYSPEEYLRYDNYDAIEVSKVSEIPYDYYGAMGVPITFLDKYNPEQFEIIGIAKTWFGGASKKYPDQVQVSEKGTKSIVTKLNDGAAIKLTSPPQKETYYIVGNEYFIQRYARILIKQKGAGQ